MRAFQSIISEAFHQDQALRMYPPEKVKARLLTTTPNPNGTRSDDFYIGGELKKMGVGGGEEFGDAPATNSDRIRRAESMIVWKLVFDMIAAIDPTPQKKYASWVMRIWMTIDKFGHPGFKFEDSGRLTMALDFLEKHKRDGALIRAGRVLKARDWSTYDGTGPWMVEFLNSNFDINRVSSLDKLEAAVAMISKVINSDPAVQMSRRQALEAVDAEFFTSGKANLCLNTTNCKIVQPLTTDASCHFGVNTRWCTAATKGRNMFRDYADGGDLYIILDKQRNKRWQIYFPHTGRAVAYDDDDEEDDEDLEGQDFQFMNEDDRPATYADLPDDAFAWLKPHLLTYHHDEGPDYMKVLHEVLGFKNKILYDMYTWDAFRRLEEGKGYEGRIISQRPGRFRMLYETMTPEIEAFIKKYWPKGFEAFVEGVQWCRLVKADDFNKAFASIWMFNETSGKGDASKHWDKTKALELPFFKSRGAWREVNGIEGIGMSGHHTVHRSEVGDASVYGVFLDTPYEYHGYSTDERAKGIRDTFNKSTWKMTGTSFGNAYWAISNKMKYTATFYDIDQDGGLSLEKSENRNIQGK